jgi:lactate racemase
VRITLAYGSSGLEVELPDDRTTVVEPVHQPASDSPESDLRAALRAPVTGLPLRHLARPGQTVAISVCDITRAQPRQLMLEAILDELEGIIRPADVTILVATGTHRATTPAELLSMLGERVLRDCRVVDHVARDRSSHVDLGMVGDVPVLLDREWVAADLRITTGFVEPHFFAGFSGGPKMVAPGLAGIDTTLELHNARRIGDPRATWGVCEGNPVHDAVRAISAATGVDFSLDVLLNHEQRITRAFGGPVLEMHAVARAVARQEAMRAVPRPFDIVVTTNSGYPLDQNLYQAVKGISAAAEVVRDGGTIICAAECRDGLPDHGSYAQLLASQDTPAQLLAAIEASSVTVPDQWQVQVQARVQARARVLVHADGLTAGQLAAAHLEPVDDIEALVGQLLRHQPDARICVLPQGPQTIAWVS